MVVVVGSVKEERRGKRMEEGEKTRMTGAVVKPGPAATL